MFGASVSDSERWKGYAVKIPLANISAACERFLDFMKLTLPRAGVVFSTLLVCAFGFLTNATTLQAETKKKAEATATPSPSAAAAASPAKSTLKLPEVVATVNGQKITREELQKAFDQATAGAGVKADDLSDDQKLDAYKQILDDLILDKLVEEKASSVQVSKADVDAEVAKIKGQFPSEKEFDEQLKRLGQTPEQFTTTVGTMLKQRKWIESQVDGKGTATEADAKAFYDANGKEFQNPDLVRASHILFMVPENAPDDVVKAKEKAAKDALARAKKGEDFTVLAKELSEEPNAKQSGGDLSFFSKEEMVPEFANVAFELKPGDLSDPVRTKFGYHVIKVTDKKAAGTIPFDEVKDRVVAYLQRQKKGEAVKVTIDALRTNSKVEVNLPGAPSSKS